MSTNPTFQRQWAESVLQGLGAPLTNANISTLVAWQSAEGGPTDNPLNTTLGQPGTQGSTIKGYGSIQAGVDATVQTLEGSQYSAVVADLKKSAGFAATGGAIVNSPWDKAHYAGTAFYNAVANAYLNGLKLAPPLIGGTAGKIAQIVGGVGTLAAGGALGGASLAAGELAAEEGAAGGAATGAAAAGAGTLDAVLAGGGIVAAVAWVAANWLRILEFLGGVVMVVYGVFLLGKVGMEA